MKILVLLAISVLSISSSIACDGKAKAGDSSQESSSNSGQQDSGN